MIKIISGARFGDLVLWQEEEINSLFFFFLNGAWNWPRRKTKGFKRVPLKEKVISFLTFKYKNHLTNVWATNNRDEEASVPAELQAKNVMNINNIKTTLWLNKNKSMSSLMVFMVQKLTPHFGLNIYIYFCSFFSSDTIALQSLQSWTQNSEVTGWGS